LTEKYNEANHKEDTIIEETGQYVVLVCSKLARVDCVEQAHKNEGLKYHSVEIDFVRRLPKCKPLSWVGINVSLVDVKRSITCEWQAK